MKAYHFVGPTLRDGRPVPPDGEWLEHDGPCVMCESGLHASRHPFDALRYAPGSTLCLVECEDVVEEVSDKLVCRRRKIVRRIDATELLRRFARQQAIKVLHLWNAPQVVRDYLATGDESLRSAARSAAWLAEASAERTAAWSAARSAARSAASEAWLSAWSAARSAASAAWLSAASAASDASVERALRAEFAAMVDEAMGGAK